MACSRQPGVPAARHRRSERTAKRAKRTLLFALLASLAGSFVCVPGVDAKTVATQPDWSSPQAFDGYGEAKARLVVLTDLGCDPDDQESLVRLLLYANDIDIEGIVATTSVCKPA